MIRHPWFVRNLHKHLRNSKPPKSHKNLAEKKFLQVYQQVNRFNVLSSKHRTTI